MCTYACLHTCTYTCTFTSLHTYVRTPVSYKHRYIRMYTRTYVHIHIHTVTHTVRTTCRSLYVPSHIARFHAIDKNTSLQYPFMQRSLSTCYEHTTLLQLKPRGSFHHHELSWTVPIAKLRDYLWTMIRNYYIVHHSIVYSIAHWFEKLACSFFSTFVADARRWRQ